MNAVYLTFDDGPDPVWTPRTLDELAAAGACATFFVLAEPVRRHPALLRRISDAGHEVANHGSTHRHPWSMSPRWARLEVRDGAHAIADVLGRAPRLYRPAFGRIRACMTDEAGACGLTTLLWDVSAMDWGAFGTAGRIRARLQKVRSGDVVLMHDAVRKRNRPNEMTTALPALLRRLWETGLQPSLIPSDAKNDLVPKDGSGAQIDGTRRVREHFAPVVRDDDSVGDEGVAEI